MAVLFQEREIAWPHSMDENSTHVCPTALIFLVLSFSEHFQSHHHPLQMIVLEGKIYFKGISIGNKMNFLKHGEDFFFLTKDV